MTIKLQVELAGLLRIGAGMTTADLDAIGERFLQRYDARSAPKVTYSRVIQPGDLVSIDVSADLDGFFADANLTVAITPVTPLKQKLIDCEVAAFEKGAAVEREVQRHGFSVLSELPGHGVGRGLHEDPAVPNIDVPRLKHKLHTGLVITIEPHISAKPSRLFQDEDGWTLRTANGSLSASYEHTVVVMPDRAVV